MPERLIPGHVATNLLAPTHGVERLAFQLVAHQFDGFARLGEDADSRVQQAQVEILGVDVLRLNGQRIEVVLVVLDGKVIGQLIDELGVACQVLGVRPQLLGLKFLAVEDGPLGQIENLRAGGGHVQQHVQTHLAKVQFFRLGLGQQGALLVFLEVQGTLLSQ